MDQDELIELLLNRLEQAYHKLGQSQEALQESQGELAELQETRTKPAYTMPQANIPAIRLDHTRELEDAVSNELNRSKAFSTGDKSIRR